MNNLISEANDLLKTAGIEQNPELVRKAVNKISMQISQALMPLNPNQYVAFLAMKQLMEDSTEKYTVKIPITDIRGE